MRGAEVYSVALFEIVIFTVSDNENSKLTFLLSYDEELANGSSKIWETFINALVVLKFLSDQIYFFLTTCTYSFK